METVGATGDTDTASMKYETKTGQGPVIIGVSKTELAQMARQIDSVHQGPKPGDQVVGDMAAWASSITPEMIAKRVKVGHTICQICKGPATAYSGDPRSRGWYRVECPEQHWYDQKALA
jgi:hypothetical protein